MAIDVVWDNDECTILRVEMMGQWSWDDLHDALTTVVEMMDEEACEQANLIIDVSHATNIPTLALTNVRNLSQRRDPRMNTTVLVGMSDVTRTLLNAFLQVYSVVGRQERYVLVKTVSKAREVIAKHAERATSTA
jgi:hypothetical protein